MSNCKILATKIHDYDLLKIKKKLKPILEKAKEFWEISFRGLYCSLCDGKKTRFFDVKYKRITLNHEFCR